jgi:Na+-transporting methylmalonyl-CoA/oxaloacetate decarboxylase gamma subunit
MLAIDMDAQTLQIATSILVPVLGFLGALANRERMPGLYRKLKHSTSALKDLPAEAANARQALERVVIAQAVAIQAREATSLTRRLNFSNLTLTIVVSLLIGAGIWGLFNWVAATIGTGWEWLSILTTVVSAVVGLIIVAASFSTLFNPPSEPKKKAPRATKAG